MKVSFKKKNTQNLPGDWEGRVKNTRKYAVGVNTSNDISKDGQKYGIYFLVQYLGDILYISLVLKIFE
jgi:hypothetical protein